jgi:superfamily II DNA or RNA helicase
MADAALPSLRSVEWPRFLRGPDAQLLERLYIPALSRAVRYDRCCAYFSSQVLAAAARGFGGFIENLLAHGERLTRPAARLLVNETLDPQDLEALLTTGDQSGLIKRLLQQFKTPQTALERNRLAMLAWLVASGWLEVRVGVMARTRGIVHAKYGLVTDLHGDVVAFMGSDNETGESLLEHYEVLEVRPSWLDAEFVEHYRDQFAALWENRDAHVRVLALPDAVRARLIQLAPAAPPREMLTDRRAVAAAMLWHFVGAAAGLPEGEAACDATAMVELWSHQRRVVDDTARAFPAGRLLCDEVGMGKTIEAIAVLRRLLAGRGVRRALLLVPAGLLGQWQEELREKGGLVVPRWESGYLVWPDGRRAAVEAPRALAEQDLLLLSREWARLVANRNLVLSAPRWDLVLLDEAHAARRSNPVEREFNSANLLLELLRQFQLRRRARSILLLSATPMQTQPWEPWDLLGVLGVGGRWLVEFEDVRRYYRTVHQLSRQMIGLPDASAVAVLVAADDGFPPPPTGVPHRDPAGLANALAFEPDEGRRRALAEWLRRGAPLGRSMHRNTRDTLRQYHAFGLLEAAPPQRSVRDEVFDYQVEAERECYEAITDYINERFENLERERPGKGFVMTIYRRRAASSPLALRRSLQRRAARLDQVIQGVWSEQWVSLDEEQFDLHALADAGLSEQVDAGLPNDPRAAAREKQQVEAILARLDALGATDSKLDKFWSVLRDITADGRAVLVFSEYSDTMEYLRDKLRPTYGSTVACYSGAGGQVWDGQRWVHVSKAEIAARLERGDLQVLVCTDAASEGLNLQAASALINYDLPWNPSRVEQRIGRIDRIGQQQRQLPIRNLFLNDSVDMRVYAVLRERCGLFEHFVGPMQPVLAQARDALLGVVARDRLEAFLTDLSHAAAAVRSDEVVNAVFWPSTAEALPAAAAPVTRRDIETALTWLEALDGKVYARRDPKRPAWRLYGLDRRALTVTLDRETLERDAGAQPITLGAPLLPRLVERLPLPGDVPLVIEAFAAGPYRGCEARWVRPDDVIPVTSAAQLVRLIEAWDGTPAPPHLRLQARDEAAAAARQRVEAMQQAAQAEEAAGLRRQLAAARRRLLRELGRTLRVLGEGDLNAIFRRQVQRESSPQERYRRALVLLGGYPDWSAEDIADATDYANRASEKERKARVAGSEVDAALNDPRWLARG